MEMVGALGNSLWMLSLTYAVDASKGGARDVGDDIAREGDGGDDDDEDCDEERAKGEGEGEVGGDEGVLLAKALSRLVIVIGDE